MRTLLLATLLACTTEPAYVARSELSKAAARGDTATLCAGLVMPDDATRRATGEALKTYTEPVACLCERVVRKGRWDAEILAGLAGARDPERFGCVGALMDDPAQPERPALAAALLKIPATRDSVLKAAKADGDPAVRAAAMLVLRGTQDPAEVEALIGLLRSEKDDAARAAVASALLAQPAAADALREAASKDAAPVVRAAALDAYNAMEQADKDTVVCAGLSDADPTVRATAAALLKGARSPARLACLRDRMRVEEPDVTARAALLKSVVSSPSPEAAAMLCDSIPAWGRMYVKDAKPEPGVDVARAQNDRDHENSYACFQKHQATAGLTCHGRAWIAGWYKDVGGPVGVPRCGAGGGAAAPAGNEVSFE